MYPRLDQLTEDALRTLLGSIRAMEPKVLQRLFEYIARMDSRGGNFLLSPLNEQAVRLLNVYVKGVLEDLGLNRDVTEFMRSFDDVAAYYLGIQRDMNGIIAPTGILTKWRQYAMFTTVERMVGQGLSTAFISPLVKALGDAVYSDGGLTDVLRNMRLFTESTAARAGGLTSHYIQVSRDAVGQYGGGVNRIVQKQYNLDALEYVGSLVKDSRPQCIRWVEQEQILIKDLPAELAWAEINGSGLIPGTNVDNFVINRGGYNCRHEAIPTRARK